MVKKKWNGMCMVVAITATTLALTAAPAAAWWSDHGPNHIAKPFVDPYWWTDHGPNHKRHACEHFTPDWWTDHGPNH